jgi:hypothetical protein
MTAVARLGAAFRAYLDARTSDPLLASFLAGFDWPQKERLLRPQRQKVVRHLDTMPMPQTDFDEHMLLAALVEAHDALDWRQTYSAEDMGADFLDNYGWVEVFGTRGHFECDAMAGGFLVLGPETFYPDHHHVAEEIYIPLTGGSLWSKDGAPFALRAQAELIHHPSDIWHAVRTAAEPLVALYLWRGGPLAQKSILVERKKI